MTAWVFVKIGSVAVSLSFVRNGCDTKCNFRENRFDSVGFCENRFDGSKIEFRENRLCDSQ